MSTSSVPVSTRWVRAPRIPAATRTDGLTVTFENGCWQVVLPGSVETLSTPAVASYLNRAIEEVDEKHPPVPWAFSGGIWRAGVWEIRPNGNGSWGIYRIIDGQEERASRQPFPSADRARRWAELRFDRGDAGLRGPKPRAGSRASFKLPDVRVTEVERDHALSMLVTLGISYSEFVRAALVWAERNVLDGDGWEIEEDEEGNHAFVPSSPAPETT
ncbi:MAG: hypothetical protein EB084_09340 [Proteobacteria bacterium]|nr:hypothetical protein [Pseudomonadota bacterium]